MRHILLTLLLGFFLSIESRADWPSEDMDEQIESTNIILGMDAQPFCSGTIISQKARLILTAAHCVSEAYSTKTITEVDPNTGEIREKRVETKRYMDVWQNVYQDYEVVSSMHFAAKPIARDATLDIAIIQVIDSKWTPGLAAPFAPKEWKIKRGQTIYVVGNPAGILDGSVSKGIVSQTQRKLQVSVSDPTPYFQVDAAIIGGNSGGAVYNENGEIIGVVSAAMRSSTIGFAVPVQFVRDILVRAGFKEFE